jgi:hypothetical protein
MQQLLARADGKPFFLEELARAVIEQGAADALPGVPETIQAVVAARIDRLPPAAKALLQLAAILGSEGPLTGFTSTCALRECRPCLSTTTWPLTMPLYIIIHHLPFDTGTCPLITPLSYVALYALFGG